MIVVVGVGGGVAGRLAAERLSMMAPAVGTSQPAAAASYLSRPCVGSRIPLACPCYLCCHSDLRCLLLQLSMSDVMLEFQDQDVGLVRTRV